MKYPATEFFMVLYYNLPVFKKGGMGVKKVKRQDFLMEISAFFKFLTDPNYFF
jgi:hypothetical protein